MALRVQVAGTIKEFHRPERGGFSAGHAFQSHRRYAFGQKVTGDCPSTHLIVRQGDRPAARAVFRLIRLGRGAYKFKHPLGLILRDNNRVGVMGAGLLSRWITGLAVPGS